MTHHHAVSKSAKLVPGASFCIRSLKIHTADTLLIELGTAAATAVVESATPFELRMRMGRETLTCQPWNRGDAELPRERGTTSNWTVGQVKVFAPAREAEPEAVA